MMEAKLKQNQTTKVIFPYTIFDGEESTIRKKQVKKEFFHENFY